MSISNDTQDFYRKVISVTDWEACLTSKNDSKKGLTPFQKNIAEEIFTSKNVPSSDSIFFSGEQPFIHIKKLSKINEEKIRLLHSRIWNEGRSPLLAVVTPVELRIYDCCRPPVEKNDEIGKLEIDRFTNIETDLKRLVKHLHQSKIDSGKIWEEEYGNKITLQNRVDKKLLSNLKATRAKLYDNGNGLPLSIIHDLLGRSLFIFYLEDRQILITDAYPKKPRGVENFSDLLNYKNETYELFDKLKEKFNGDLFPISDDERLKVSVSDLLEVRKCFHDYDVISLQPSLWRMFQFEYVPIELISAIYEEFMSAEEDDEKGQTTIREKGAYYTKPMLVEFMLNEVLPWPDEHNTRYNYKILDPACGSGIFLVESYRRLIARWKLANKKKKIDESSLRQILIDSIYGMDKDTEAIKVAAFSLYLVFLNYLEPLEIRNDYLENKSKKLDPLIRWSDRKEIKERENKRQGNNLFQFNTFSNCDITKVQFDIIIGNPPWKKDKPEKIVASYIDANKLPAQIVCAYVDFMPKMLKDDGIIALVIAAKILFNTGGGYENFRQTLFKQYTVDTIVNLSVVRDIMFDNASAPACVIIYHKKNTEKQVNPIVYCIPKNIKSINNKQSLIIDATEIKYLPLKEVVKKHSRILKIAMWGGMRDYLFLERLNQTPSIRESLKSSEQGIGLHVIGNNDETLNEKFKEYKFVPLGKIKKYYTPDSDYQKLGDNYLKYRNLNDGIFESPILLLRRGSKNSEIIFSYVDFDCVFGDSLYGISMRNKSVNYLKAIVAILNSSLAKYYFFLTSSRWAIDKGGDLLHTEMLSFPAIFDSIDSSIITKLAYKVDTIALLGKNAKSSESHIKAKDNKIDPATLFDIYETNSKAPFPSIEEIENEIDDIIFAAIGLSENEKCLINDVLNNSLGLIRHYIQNGAEEPVMSTISYAEKLSSTLNNTLKYGKSNAVIEVLGTHDQTPVNIAIIHFDKDNEKSPFVTDLPYKQFEKLLKEINEFSFEQHSESIYYRKVIKYYKNDKIYLIKPNEKRYWTISEALNDADSILADLLTS